MSHALGVTKPMKHLASPQGSSSIGWPKGHILLPLFGPISFNPFLFNE